MSRFIRIEVSARNVVLLVLALALCALLIGFGARFLAHSSQHAATEPHDGRGTPKGQSEQEHAGHEESRERSREKPLDDGRIRLSPEALRNADLEILTAGPREVNVTLSLPGEVSLNQDAVAHVTPRVAGTAREVKKQVGEIVKKGDVLAILDSRDLAEAQRDFLATKERMALARGTFERAEMLQRENISAEKDYLAAKQAFAEAQIEHRSAAQKLQAIGGAGVAGGYALIAPFAGTIIEKHISVGEVLNEESRAFIVADLSTIWVNVTVYAKDLPRVAVGQSADVRAEGIAEPAQGTIVYLGQVVGEQTRSATARVILKNPGAAWRPGLFATAEVTVDRGLAEVVVDDDAVQTLEGQTVVFALEGEAFEARRVKLGRRGTSPERKDRRIVEVLDGLSANERYVSKNSFILKAELGKSEAGHDH